MVQKTFTITNKMGLHMRPANTFVTEMSKFSSDIDKKAEELITSGFGEE